MTVGNPLLSYLDVQLPRFLPQRLTSREAKHLDPQLVRHNSFEPIQDGLGDTIFQGRAVHIPLEAPILGELTRKGSVAEEEIPEEPVLSNLVEEMVQKHSMALDR